MRSRSLDVEPHDQQCSAWLSSQTEMSNAQMLHPFLPLQFRNSSGFTLRSYQFQMATLRELGLWNTVTPDGVTGFVYDDDVGLHVLGCWVDILGTNCNHCLFITWDLSSYSVLYRDITYIRLFLYSLNIALRHRCKLCLQHVQCEQKHCGQ